MTDAVLWSPALMTIQTHSTTSTAISRLPRTMPIRVPNSTPK